MADPPEAGTTPRAGGVPRNVKALGAVSLLTDASSEMVYPVLPLFLANVLGAPVAAIGLIESVAEATASFLKVASGWLSDRVGRRRPLRAHRPELICWPRSSALRLTAPPKPRLKR